MKTSQVCHSLIQENVETPYDTIVDDTRTTIS